MRQGIWNRGCPMRRQTDTLSMGSILFLLTKQRSLRFTSTDSWRELLQKSVSARLVSAGVLAVGYGQMSHCTKLDYVISHCIGS